MQTGIASMPIQDTTLTGFIPTSNSHAALGHTSQASVRQIALMPVKATSLGMQALLLKPPAKPVATNRIQAKPPAYSLNRATMFRTKDQFVRINALQDPTNRHQEQPGAMMQTRDTS
jgi:hypothetical protein